MSIPKKTGAAIITCFCMAVSAMADEKEMIEQTIRHYNQSLIVAARTGETDLVKPFVSDAIATKTHLWVMAWHDDQLHMIARLLDLKFDSLNKKEKQMRMKTFEKWTYRYDHPRKQNYYPEQRIAYQMEYSLHQEKGKWIIDNIEVLSEKKSNVDVIKSDIEKN